MECMIGKYDMSKKKRLQQRVRANYIQAIGMLQKTSNESFHLKLIFGKYDMSKKKVTVD
jgi:hypothetical protein